MEQKLIHTPEGVRDIYGSELSARKKISEKILETFRLYGCREIKTPTFEYFDIFSNEIGTTPSRELYKFFDKEGDTLVLRPDFTPSAARCAVKYFLESSDSIRLSYHGDAFANTSNLQGKLKETTQIGAEFIGEGDAYADADILSMVIETLKNTGFKDFTLSIGEVDFFKGLCEEAALSDESVLKLREQISIKNYYGAAEMLEHRNVKKEITDLIINSGDVISADDLGSILEKCSNDKSKKAIERLIKIYSLMQERGFADYISIDLGMLSKFNYYTGLIFKAYVYGAGDAIVKGGRYDGLLQKFGKDAPAVGCVFLLDDLMGALEGIKTEDNEPVVITYTDKDRKEALEKINALRLEGRAAYGIYKG